MLEHLDDLQRAYAGLDGLALLRALLKEGPLAGRTALVSSFGAESAVLLDMVATVDPATPVIFLDTGKLFAETHAYREELVDLLRLTDVRVVRPRAAAVARHDPGGALWSRDPDLCCHVRKTEPLQEALAGFAAWITGRKRFQAGLRSQLPIIEPEWSSGRIKLNPLALWSAEDVEQYRLLRNLPRHPLVDHGYRSIGCVTCTRPVSVGRGATRGPLVGPGQDRMRHSSGGRGGVRGQLELPEFAPGSVWLVGAGPGDPGLLTLHAAHALACADIVLHDALVAPEILALAGPAARFEPVGKRAGRAGRGAAQDQPAPDRAGARRPARAASQGRRSVRVRAWWRGGARAGRGRRARSGSFRGSHPASAASPTPASR